MYAELDDLLSEVEGAWKEPKKKAARPARSAPRTAAPARAAASGSSGRAASRFAAARAAAEAHDASPTPTSYRSGGDSWGGGGGDVDLDDLLSEVGASVPSSRRESKRSSGWHQGSGSRSGASSYGSGGDSSRAAAKPGSFAARMASRGSGASAPSGAAKPGSFAARMASRSGATATSDSFGSRSTASGRASDGRSVAARVADSDDASGSTPSFGASATASYKSVSDNSGLATEGGDKKCGTVYVGGCLATFGRSRPGLRRSKTCCNNLRCTSCDFSVLRLPGFKWDATVDYMFFRNNVPDVPKLKPKAVAASGWNAYCCQCTWHSTDTVQKLSTLETYWVCAGHAT